MKNMFKSLKQINMKMFVSLLLFGLIPTLYTTFRIFLIGTLPGDGGFSIASQLQWVGLLYEILQEALILPLFFFIGAVITNREELTNRVKTGLLFTFAIYLVLSTTIFIFAKPLVTFMAQDQTLINETVSYIRLETIAMIFKTLFKYIMVVIVTLRKDVNVYLVLLFQLILIVILDVFFVSTLNISLNLGVNGIAVSNIISNVILLLISFYILYRNDINLFKRSRLNFTWIKDLFKKGGISGLESFVRNIAFMLMIVRIVNVVGKQGVFWIANSFIWGWILLPILQLGELIKADVSDGGNKTIERNNKAYFILTTIIIVIWFITMPLYEPFMNKVLKIADYKEVYDVIKVSILFYVMFAYNNIIDSYFYGLGKTSYMLFQSLVINIFFYGTMFILHKTGVFEPTLIKLALMFAGGIALDSIVTMIMFKWYAKKEELNFNIANDNK